MPDKLEFQIRWDKATRTKTWRASVDNNESVEACIRVIEKFSVAESYEQLPPDLQELLLRLEAELRLKKRKPSHRAAGGAA